MRQHCSDGVQDTDDMDYLLPQSITELGNCLMQLAATLIFVSIVQPIFLAGPLPPQFVSTLDVYSSNGIRSCHELTIQIHLNSQSGRLAG